MQRKRSLILVVTNSRDEDLDELLLAVRQLQQRHLVTVANLRETVLDETLRRPVGNFDDAATYAGTVAYLQHRSAAHKKLQASGILALDCLPRELASALANHYWEIKRTGAL